MNIAIIQSRYNSTRLPGKAMMMLAGRPSLEHVIDRVKAAKYLDSVIVATGIDEVNAPIRKLCKEKSIPCFSGDNDNVLKRYCDLLLKGNFKLSDNVVRITADCPLIDPIIIDKMLSEMGKKEYLGNQNNMIDGFDVEIIKVKHLFYALTMYEYDEHVTLKWKNNNFELLDYYWYDNKDRTNIHLSLDTIYDYKLIGKIYDKLYPIKPLFEYKDVLDYMETY